MIQFNRLSKLLSDKKRRDSIKMKLIVNFGLKQVMFCFLFF